MRPLRPVYLLFIAICFLPKTALGDCVADLRGEIYCGAGRCAVADTGKIWCSRHYEGDALVTLEGKVLCGKGQCTRDPHGHAFCSSEIGGSVMTDAHGRVRCYGRCEPASEQHCESSLADSAGG